MIACRIWGHMSSRELANIVLMAFDGYALNFHLSVGNTLGNASVGDAFIQ